LYTAGAVGPQTKKLAGVAFVVSLAGVLVGFGAMEASAPRVAR
jgi:hypothetical protein